MQSGKAPTKTGLREIFKRFRNWLIQIYNDLTGTGMKPSDEVKEVFDRWIANSKEIQTQIEEPMSDSAKAAYRQVVDALGAGGKPTEKEQMSAIIIARMADRLSEAWKEAGREKSALDLLPDIVKETNENWENSLAGNPEAEAKFFSERANGGNALARVHDGMQLEDIRERLLREENTAVSNAADYYEFIQADKRASQAMKDDAYDRLLSAVEDIDGKRRAFGNEEVIESLDGVLRGKIRIGEGSNLEKDLSGDYRRRTGDIQKETPGAQLIPGEYKRIEEKTKARKELFAKMRQEIRERSATTDIDEKRRAFDNERVLESLGQVLRGKIRIGEGSNLEKDLSGDYARRAGDIQKETSGAINIPGEYGRIEQKHKDLFAKIRQDIRERSVRDALSRGDEMFLQKVMSQTAEVRRRYQGTRQWMRAPNGQPTNLTEEQWLAVRTPAFKAWFGDWEAASKKEYLRNGKLVELSVAKDFDSIIPKEITKNYLNGKKNSKGEMAKALRKYVPDVVRGTVVGDVNISNNSLADTLHHSGGIGKVATLPIIDKLLKSAVEAGTRKIGGGRTSYILAAPMVSDGKFKGTRFVVMMVVNEDRNGNKFYDHELTTIKKLDEVPAVASQKAGKTDMGNHHQAVIDIVAEDLWAVNDASKVVDENGEPLVVYHGSDADFNVFDASKSRENMDIQGNSFTPWELDAQGYGANVRAFFLNIRNPADSGKGYKALNSFKGQMALV